MAAEPFIPPIEEFEGVPYIAGTGIKVVLIVEETMLGRSPQQIQEAHPHLSLAQIHAALYYYYTHKEMLDAEIAHRREFEEQTLSRLSHRKTREELEARRKKHQHVAN